MELILLTAASQPTAEVLPALGLLAHHVTVLPLDASRLVDRPLGDVILVDARRDLASARSFTRILDAVAVRVPVIAVLTEGGLVALSAEWAVRRHRAGHRRAGRAGCPAAVGDRAQGDCRGRRCRSRWTSAS